MNNDFLTPPQVLTSSDAWLVLSKPAGWLTIPGRHLSEIPSVSEWARKSFGDIWVVHRLDRETSGVLLLARTAEAHALANGWFQKRQMKKVYHCLAAPSEKRVVLKTPFFKINEAIEGAPSVTQVEIKENYQEAFFARILPATGRRHQIRIHLSLKGYPLLGDPTYGGRKDLELRSQTLNIERVALHASSLELPTREKFEAPLPEDFTKWLECLRKEGRRV